MPTEHSDPVAPSRLVVVKLGGSLLDWVELPGALSSYLDGQKANRLILVVGGGKIVDAIREIDRVQGLGEERSHGLSLRGMDLTARIVAALLPGLEVVDSIDRLEPTWGRDATPVFAPRRFLDRDDRTGSDPLPHGWHVTSDSISARLAVRLRADQLVLLKSTSARDGLDRDGAADRGLVDPVFPTAARLIPRVSLINLRDPGLTAVDLR